jgi:hypothetical protein
MYASLCVVLPSLKDWRWVQERPACNKREREARQSNYPAEAEKRKTHARGKNNAACDSAWCDFRPVFPTRVRVFWKQFRVKSSRKYDASILPTVCIQLGDKDSSDDDLGADARCKCDRVSRR